MCSSLIESCNTKSSNEFDTATDAEAVTLLDSEWTDDQLSWLDYVLLAPGLGCDFTFGE
jgi:sarcosine oxidase delta subunit